MNEAEVYNVIDTKWVHNPIKITNIFTGEVLYFLRQTDAAKYIDYSIGSFNAALNEKKLLGHVYRVERTTMEEFFKNEAAAN